MSCIIESVKEEQCVFITYNGIMPPVRIMAARYEAAGVISRRRWHKVVVNIVALQCNFNALELIHLARDLSSDLSPKDRIALVIRPEQEKQAGIIQHVAQMDGLCLNYFFNPAAARSWVIENAAHGTNASPAKVRGRSKKQKNESPKLLPETPAVPRTDAIPV